MSEYEAETLQTQAQTAGHLVRRAGAPRQADDRARSSPCSRRARSACRCSTWPASTSTRSTRITSISRSRRRGACCRCYKRSNKLFVAVSDPANLQALDEVRFKTNLVPEPIVVEDDKLGRPSHKLVEASGATLKDWRNLDDIEVGLEDGDARAGQRTRRRRRRGRAGRQVHPEDPARRDQPPAPRTSISSRTRSTTACATASTAC